MELNAQGLKNRLLWENAGYELPRYDREAAAERTARDPFWIHFGVGNLFRAFQANAVQRLLNQGILDRGLVAAEGFDYEIIEKLDRPHDHYSILVTLKADGRIEKTVLGSVMEAYALDAERNAEFARLKEIFTKDSLQIASFTITEKGYCLTDSRGETLKAAAEDFRKGPGRPESYMGKVAALLYERFLSEEKPLAMVSMDNCSHNGEKLYAAIHEFAENWEKNGLVKTGFLAYVEDPEKVSFPWTMIDKITPRPDESICGILKKDGVEGIEPVITSKNTYGAPFVNAEECEYLVVEDAFPNGRPRLEKAGLLFADRGTVERAEKMKVCTCLNPLHTCLAIFGCLLGYERISEEMKDRELRRLAETIGYAEGLPAAADPGVLVPKEFLDTVLKVRLPNPFIPDTPQRIATDTSQKLAVRFGETIKAYLASKEKDSGNLKCIPLVFAGWLRYLLGVDDRGEAFVLSPDPMLDTLRPYLLKHVTLGSAVKADALRPVLESREIFGVDLYEAGLADQVIRYLNEMTEGPGAVRKTLKRYV